MQVSEVKKILDCEEIALTDTYGEEEQVAGWFECLSEALDEIDEVEIFGELAHFKGLEQQGNQVLMKVRRNRKQAKITLDSVSFLQAPRYVKTWIKAYNKYCS